MTRQAWVGQSRVWLAEIRPAHVSAHTGVSRMSSISNTMRDTAKNAMDAGQEAGQAASAGARNIQADLVSLRDEVARLTHQIANIFAAKGTASWQRAKSDLDGVISDAGEKGREAIGAVREVGDNVVDAVDKSLKQRPYTALALAAGLGFLFGVIWRR